MRPTIWDCFRFIRMTIASLPYPRYWAILNWSYKPHADNWFSILFLNHHPAPGFESLRITVRTGVRERFTGKQIHFTNGARISLPEGGECEIPEETSQKRTNRVGRCRIVDPDLDIFGDPNISIQFLRSGVLDLRYKVTVQLFMIQSTTKKPFGQVGVEI